ncbi:hypothetical protein [Bacillus sp. T3]|uniref:hypothetical protein n=1 Tax=Bacillus sp. T3 TaxID=467262 RepID=UPI0029820709|nr:hypothetical protein [Bacillus sp. T3]
MKLLSFLLFVGLVVISTWPHLYYLWKREEHKTFKVVIGILSLAAVAGVILIFGIQVPSIASLFNGLNDLVK